MNRPDPHDLGELSAHALGLLDDAAARSVEQHLRVCGTCRQQWSELRGTTALLDEVPPEMFLDGPPDGELMLRRTLREVRNEKRRAQRGQRFRMVGAAAAVLVVLTGAGVVVGRVTAEPQPAVVALPAGTVTLEGSADGPDGPVTMSADIVPSVGWVRLAATVSGIPPGERCTLVVVAEDGTEHDGGSWLVAPRGQGPGATINGSAIVAPDDVAAVSVRNDEGTTFITLPV